MSKELDEFYKSYSARIIAIDDTPSVEVMDGGKFKLLSIEEYEEMTNKIADLETKLAECEKKAYSRGHSQRNIANEIKLNALREDVANKEKRIVKLKQQLAEKEKEIESLKHFKVTIGTMETNQVDISSTTYIDKDKISFAVEQLEQLKKLCQEKFNWWENSEWEGDIYDKSDVSNAYFDIEANVDNQIEELKKEMK